MPTDILGLTIQIDTKGAEAAQASMDKTRQSANQLSDTTKKLKTDMDAAFGPSTTSNDIFGPIVPGATKAAAETKKLGSEILNTNAATKEFRDTMRVVRPLLSEIGVSMGGIGGYMGAARTGFAGLAIAIGGGFVAAVETASDKLSVLQSRLDAIAGTKVGGAQLFANLQGAADNLRTPLSSLAGAFETLTLAQQKNERASGVVYGSFQAGSTKMKDAIEAIGYAVRAGGGISTDILKVETDFANALAKAKGLDAALFDKLASDAPVVANAIANAFGIRGAGAIAEFSRRLGDTTIPIGKVLEALARYREEAKQIADGKESTLAQAWDDLTTSIGKAMQAMGLATGAAKILDEMAKSVDSAVAGWSRLGEAIRTFSLGDWGNVIKTAFGGIYDIMVKIASVAPFGSFLGVVGSVVSGIRAISEAAQQAYEWWLKLSQVRTGGAVGGGPSPEGGGNGTAGGATNASSNSGNGVAGGNGGYVVGGSAEDMKGGIDFAGATGASFQVKGTGGTDSQRVTLRATPGETISITPPSGGPRPTATSDFDAGHFADGGSFTVPDTTTTSGQHIPGNVDSALSSASQSLVATVRKMSDELSGFGVDEEGTKSTISGAGNGKMSDVIRLSSIQQVSATTQAADRIISTIMNGDINITAAINAMTAAQTASATAAAAASASSGSTSSGTSSSSATQTGLSGLAKGGGKDTTMGNGAQMALWNSLYGDLYKGSPTSGGSPTAGSNPQTPSTTMVSATGLGPPGKSLSAMDKSMQAAYEAASAAGYPGEDAFGAGADFAGASGGEFDVPPGFNNDSFKLRAQTGERVKITPKELNKPNSSKGDSSPRPINVTVNIQAKDPSSFDNSKAQVANTLRVTLSDALRHV